MIYLLDSWNKANFTFKLEIPCNILQFKQYNTIHTSYTYNNKGQGFFIFTLVGIMILFDQSNSDSSIYYACIII